jgi:hypothetical protein
MNLAGITYEEFGRDLITTRISTVQMWYAATVHGTMLRCLQIEKQRTFQKKGEKKNKNLFNPLQPCLHVFSDLCFVGGSSRSKANRQPPG